MYESIEELLTRIDLESDHDIDKALDRVMDEHPEIDQEWGSEMVREYYEDEFSSDENDGQPSMYEEYQDLPWGGDDMFETCSYAEDF